MGRGCQLQKLPVHGKRAMAAQSQRCVLVFDSKALELWSRNHLPGAPVSAVRLPPVNHAPARGETASLFGRHRERLGQTRVRP